MLERFEGLPKEKQQRIINAGYKVFSTFGYKKASTNDIIAEAGISKGLLFHYFKSKKGLYCYLYKLSIDLLSEKLYMGIDTVEPDILKRLRSVITAKITLVCQYPKLFDFLKSAYFEQDEEIKQLVEETNNKLYAKNYELMYNNLDLSVFREGIDSQLAIQTIFATLGNWSESYVMKCIDKPVISIIDETLEEELNRYMNFFERSFYKTTT